jgi:hypothetical protein
MTELPHVFLRLKLVVDGQSSDGLASEGLPPKWFTKDPTTRFEEDLPLMLEVLQNAAASALAVEGEATVFGFWRELYRRQDGWAKEKAVPPVLAHLGTALVERTGIRAAPCSGATRARHWCREIAGGDSQP